MLCKRFSSATLPDTVHHPSRDNDNRWIYIFQDRLVITRGKTTRRVARGVYSFLVTRPLRPMMGINAHHRLDPCGNCNVIDARARHLRYWNIESMIDCVTRILFACFNYKEVLWFFSNCINVLFLNIFFFRVRVGRRKIGIDYIYFKKLLPIRVQVRNELKWINDERLLLKVWLWGSLFNFNDDEICIKSII